MTDILPGVMSAGGVVQEEIARVIGSLACVLTENTVIRKLDKNLCFDDPVCNSITFVCPDCDSDAANKTGDLFWSTWHSLCMVNRPFAGQGHVTMSMMKIGVSTKWLPEMKRA